MNFKYQYTACAICLFTLVLGVFGLVFTTGVKGIAIESSIQSLLPKNNDQIFVQSASDKLFSFSGRKAIFIVEAKKRDEAIQAANIVQNHLNASPYFQVIKTGNQQEQSNKLLHNLSAHAFNFLSDSHRQKLLEGNTEGLLEEARSALFDFTSENRILPPNKDPLGVFNHWFSSIYSFPENLYYEDGFLFAATSSKKESYNIVIIAELEGDALGTRIQNHVTQLVNTISKETPKDVRISRSGMVFHSAETAATAKQEITLVSVGSTIGIIMLFLFAFSSPKPLILSLTSIVFGCISATVITHFLFSQIHIFTLVFGASLIGVTIDYSLHFFVGLYHQNQKTTAIKTIEGIFPEILAGLITSLVGFSCLMQSTLPGLDQIAVFSVVGLASAWLFVVVVYPATYRRHYNPIKHSVDNRHRYLYQLAIIFFGFWRKIGVRNVTLAYFMVVTISSVILIQHIQWSTDIRSLNVSSKNLLAEELRVSEVLSLQTSSQFFVVTGSSPEQLLQEEESFLEKLDPLKNTSAIKTYDATSLYLPSKNKQYENYQLLRNTLFSDSRKAESFLHSVGMSPRFINDYTEAFKPKKNHPLELDTWLASASPEQAMLWLGKTNGKYISIIALRNVTDVSPLKTLADNEPNVLFVDKVANISTSLNTQRSQASALLILAYLVIALFMLLKYRKFQSLSIVAVPLSATILTLTVLSVFNLEIGLFHIFGLFLVLGLGMDYGIFLAGSSNECSRSFIAILLSALTSCLSFGLLSLSSIPMIHAFGITILLGSLLNLLIVPFVAIIHGIDIVLKTEASGAET